MANINQISPDGGTTVYDIEDPTARSGVNNLTPRVGIAEGKITTLQEQMLSVQNDLGGLGTASTKNSTSVVTESSDLVESGAVKDLIGWGNKNALPYQTEIKTGSGSLTVTPSNNRYSFTGTAGGASAILYPVTVPINSGVYRFVADGYEHVEGSNISLYYNDNGTTKALAPDETIDLSIYAITAIAFFAGANNSVNYLNIGLMLVKESESDKSFEPYHASVEESLAEKCDNSVIGTVEDGATASQAYAVGEHFIRGGKFCTVTQDISSGGTLTEGTNYTTGDVANNLDLLLRVAPFSQYGGDCNNLPAGFAYANGNASNVPETYSIVITLSSSNNSLTSGYMTQFCIPQGVDGRFYMRNKNNGTWSDWYKFEGTIVS